MLKFGVFNIQKILKIGGNGRQYIISQLSVKTVAALLVLVMVFDGVMVPLQFGFLSSFEPQSAYAASSSWNFNGGANGSGDANIVNPSSTIKLKPNWWNTNYSKRQKVTVNATDAVANGYSAKANVDLESLRTAGKVNNDLSDVRVVAKDRTTGTSSELDRDIVKGEALSFNGSGDYVNAGNGSSLNLTAGLSLEAWIYPTALGNTLDRSIIEKYGGASGTAYSMRTANSKIRFVFYAAGSWRAYETDNQVLAINNWYHVVITCPSTTIYINGTAVSGSWVAGSETTLTTNTGPLTIGGGSGAISNFQGQIDEVRVSNTARYSSNFVPQHTPFTPDANTAGLWHLDGDANDSSVNGNNGTLVGNPYYMEGKVISSGSNAEVWFKTQSAINASSDSENSGNHSYYMYYGNASAANPPENKDNVYEFQDDFSGGSINTSKWTTVGGTGSVSEGQAYPPVVSGWDTSGMYTTMNFNRADSLIFEVDLRVTSGYQCFGWKNSTSGISSYTDIMHGVYIDTSNGGQDILNNGIFSNQNLNWASGQYQWKQFLKPGGGSTYERKNSSGVVDFTYQDSTFTGTPLKIGIITAGGTVGYDNFKVRLYTPNEPTTSFASEESAGTAYATPGVWTSDPIAPANHYDWGTLTIGKTTPGASTLTVDVLRSSDSTVLATDVASGTDLSTVISNSEKSIKLRANLSGGVDTPTLSALSLDYSTDAIAPTDPSNLQITSVGSNSVDLSWTASTDTGGSILAGYKIERAPDNAGSPGTFAQVGTSATSSYTDAAASGNTKYWYRVRAYDNAGNNSSYAGLDGYNYKKSITFDTTAQGANVATNQSNFPVAVHINSSSWPSSSERTNFFDATNVGGKRVRFYDSDESTVLDYEVEYYDQASQEAIYWVRVPQVDGNSSTDNIVVAYGNDPNGSNQDNGTGVWDSNTKLIQHYPDGTTLSANDSTSNGNNGTLNNGVTAGTGEVDGAASFDGVDDYVNTGTNSVLNINGTITISAWIKSSVDATTYKMIVSKEESSTVNPYRIYLQPNGLPTFTDKFTNGGVIGNIALNDDAWHHLVAVRDNVAKISKMYIDGTLNTQSSVYSGTNPLAASSTPTWIGKTPFANRFPFPGPIDEAHISNATRSADWIKLEYYSAKKTNFNGDNGEGASQFINFGSEVSTYISTTTLADTPVSPSATAASASQINVSWASGGSQDHYHVKSSPDSYASNIYDSTSTSTSESGLSADSQYTYRIYGVNTDNVESSSYATVSKYSLANAPGTPTATNATSSSLDVVINKNSNPSNTTYAIYNNTAAQYVQADGTLGASATQQTYSAWGGASGITNTGLNSSTSYTYKVKAKNGDSVETAFSSNSTPLSTLAGTPAAPTIGTATALSSTSIKYNFTDNADNEDGFKIHDENHNVVGTVTSANQTSITETGLSPNTQYTRHIHAYNGAGDSSASSSVSKYTLAASPSVTSTKDTTSWYNNGLIFFTSLNAFGTGGVAYYRYSLSENSNYIVSNTDSLWNSGTLPGITSSSGIYYLNIKSYNGEDIPTSQTTYGPFHFDLEKPKVSITSHTSGDYVKGKITLEAQVSDNVGIADIGFYDNSLSNKIGSSATTVFDTTKVSEGPRTIYAKTSDYAGNTVAHVIILNVDNTKPKPRSQKPGKKKGSAKAGTLKVKKGSSVKLYYRVDDKSSETTTKIYIYKRYKRKSFKARLKRSFYIRNRRARLRRAYHKIKRSKNRGLKRRARSFARQIRSYNRQLGRYNPYYIKTIKTYKKKVSTNKKIYYRYRATRKGVYRVAITAYDEANNRSAKPMVQWVNVK